MGEAKSADSYLWPAGGQFDLGRQAMCRVGVLVTAESPWRQRLICLPWSVAYIYKCIFFDMCLRILLRQPPYLPTPNWWNVAHQTAVYRVTLRSRMELRILLSPHFPRLRVPGNTHIRANWPWSMYTSPCEYVPVCGPCATFVFESRSTLPPTRWIFAFITDMRLDSP